MNKLFKKAYYLGTFLILIPSFSLGGFFSTIHNIGGFIFLLLFLIILPIIIIKKKTLNMDKHLLILFLLLFITQSASILSAGNISAFLTSYRIIIFSGIFFLLSIYFINDSKSLKNMVLVLFAVALVDIVFQTFILLFPNAFNSFGQVFVNNNYLTTVYADVSRGRVNVADYDELLLPIILFYWIKNKNRKLLLPFTVFISIFSFFSGFRIKIVMLLFALVGSFIVFFKDIKKYFVFLLIIPLIFYFLYNLQSDNVINRFLLTNQVNLSTIQSRVNRWGIAFDMGLSSPITGVGLGNYYDNLPSEDQKIYSVDPQNKALFDAASTDPHNIFFLTFAETGGVGLSAFIFLLLYFLKNDLYILKGKKDLSKALVVSFWSLFIFSVLNPSVNIAYLSLFWLLRVMVEKSFSLSRL